MKVGGGRKVEREEGREDGKCGGKGEKLRGKGQAAKREAVCGGRRTTEKTSGESAVHQIAAFTTFAHWPTRKPHCSETAFFAKVSHQASTAASAMADRPMSEVVLGRWRSTLEEHAGGGWRTAAPARCNPPHRRTASRGQDKESAYQVVLKTLIGKSNRRRKSNLICVGVQNAYPKLKYGYSPLIIVLNVV